MNKPADRSTIYKFLNFSTLALSLLLFQNCGNLKSKTSENNQSPSLNDVDLTFSADSLSSNQTGIQPASSAIGSTVNTNITAGITVTETCYQYGPNYYNVEQKCVIKRTFPILTLNAMVIKLPGYIAQITASVTSAVPANLYLSASAQVGIVGYQNSVNCGLNLFKLNQNHTLTNLNCSQYSMTYKKFGDPLIKETLGRLVCEISSLSQCL